MTEALKGRDIEFRVKEWHVLQVWKDDLKIEFDPMEHWMKGISRADNFLHIGAIRLRMVSLMDLRELYRRGLADTANHADENSRAKYRALREKLNLLIDTDHLGER